jgi:hypothetical protein
MHRPVFLYITFVAGVLLINALRSPTARADGINFNSQLNYLNSSGETTIEATGEKISNDFSRWDQRYNLDVSKNIYSYLTFETGAFYELDQATSKTDGDKTDFEVTTLRPYAELNLNNPIYQAGITVRKLRRDEEVTDLPDTRADQDEMIAILGMTPAKVFPEWRLTLERTHTYDDPETVDRVVDLYNLDTHYTPWTTLLLDYVYTRVDTDDRFGGFDTLDQTHFGRIGYSRNFLTNRLALNTEYRIRYQTFEFPSSAVVESPLVRSAGLSALDQTPEDGPALDVNNALIDGNLIASAGLNIGASGDQSTFVNIGLDFGFPVDVDTLYVWVDRRLPTPVADFFAWTVYTSPDNNDSSTWTPVDTIAPADFGAFDNRFEISFPVVNTRFIKVVTSALAPTNIGAADFPNIFVTEMQAFVTVSGADVDNKQTTVDHNYNLNLRGKLTARTTVGYNLLYNHRENDPGAEKRTKLTNGLNLNHIFNDVFSANANGQRSDTTVRDEDAIDYTYGAALKANWINTFNQSFTYSGIYRDAEDGTAFQNSLFLRNNAQLYRGWSVLLDSGYTWQESLENERLTSWVLTSGTNFVPNEKITLNANYSYRRVDQSGLDVGPTSETQWDIQAFYNPYSNLSLFGKISIVDREDSNDIFQNYSVNWSPFPDGDLQVFFLYSETLRSQFDTRDTVVGPGLKWTLGRHILFDMTYNYTRNETITQTTEANVFNGELRLVF